MLRRMARTLSELLCQSRTHPASPMTYRNGSLLIFHTGNRKSCYHRNIDKSSLSSAAMTNMLDRIPAALWLVKYQTEVFSPYLPVNAYCDSTRLFARMLIDLKTET